MVSIGMLPGGHALTDETTDETEQENQLDGMDAGGLGHLDGLYSSVHDIRSGGV